MTPDFSELERMLEQTAEFDRRIRAEVEATSMIHLRDQILHAQAAAEGATVALAERAGLLSDLAWQAREREMEQIAAIVRMEEDASQLARQLAMESQFAEAERFARQLADVTRFTEVEAYLTAIQGPAQLVEEMARVRREMTLYLRTFDSELDALRAMDWSPPSERPRTPVSPPTRPTPRTSRHWSEPGVRLPWGGMITRREIVMMAISNGILSVVSSVVSLVAGGPSVNIDRSTTYIYIQLQIVVVCEDTRALKEPTEEGDTIEEMPSGTKITTFERTNEWCPIWPGGKLETGWVLPKSLMEPEG